MSERPVLLEALRALQEVLDDVLGVLREQAGRLDLERSRTFLRLLEQALGRSDLVPVLERLVEAAEGARS